MSSRNTLRKYSFKSVVFFLQICTSLVFKRTFGYIIHDIVRATDGAVGKADLRRLEKLAWKQKKAENDFTFLKRLSHI